MSLKNKALLIYLFVVISLLVMPVYAESNYLFPSDIIDQSEQAQYDVGRANRYAERRQWVYPQESQASGNKSFYPDSNQYATSDSQRAFKQNQSQSYQNKNYQAQQEQLQADNVVPGANLFSESEHYKYSNFKTGDSQTSPVVQRYDDEQLRPTGYLSKGFRYPVESNANQFSNRIRQQKMKTDFSATAGNIKHRENAGLYPNLLYPSDMEANRRLSNKNAYRPNSFSQNTFSTNTYGSHTDYGKQMEQERQNIKIQYVPVPVYAVPGTLPGTVPGVVTPGKMVPGYSHLSPSSNYGGLSPNLSNYGLYPGLHSNLQQQRLLNRRNFNQYGINPFMGSQYNPLTGLGGFPGGSNPFDTFYKTYDNHSQNVMPFTTPDTMVPGFSMPDMFSTQ